MTIRKLEVLPGGKEELVNRINALERNLRTLIERAEKGLALLGVLSERFEGAMHALYEMKVLPRSLHSQYARAFSQHEKMLRDIRSKATAFERVKLAQSLNDMLSDADEHPRFLVYLEDLELFNLLRDGNGAPTMSQDDAAKIFDSGVPYTVYIETFFREVYGLEVVPDEEPKKKSPEGTPGP